MKAGFYPRLAWDAIRKNKRLYFPYILTGSVMAMMFYILCSLRESPTLENAAGGSFLMAILPFGCTVIAIFSLIFLFYTNSFLIKQRNREFGLYNVLGMDKRNISLLMLWEGVFTAVLAIACGIVGGITLSKSAELILLNMLGAEISFDITVSLISIIYTVLLYSAIYVILLANSLVRVWRAGPLELIQSDSVGERVPRFTLPLGILGAVLIGVAYYLAVNIEEPTAAMLVFFLAVIMVICGTYLLFISGSVAFCRLLQKNKRYYYKPNHFVSVSSMVYRMKRNGAGLASICILLTMVLVMLSSTASLYFAEEESLRNRYPNGINIKVDYHSVDGLDPDNIGYIKNAITELGVDASQLDDVRICSLGGLFTDDGIILDYSSMRRGDIIVNYDNVGYLNVSPVDDYNRISGRSVTLADDECLIYSDRLSSLVGSMDTFTPENGSTYKIKEHLSEYRADGDSLVMTMPTVYIVVNDLAAFAENIPSDDELEYGITASYIWKCGFDASSPERELELMDGMFEFIRDNTDEDVSWEYIQVISRENERLGFVGTYGSLFFLGIMLSVVFLLAAVLIIYYKQISEGYEDRSRFEIMQKVGMTKRDIRQSINSQMLTVFFLPLITAGLHLAFAFPFISKILLMFAFDNTLFNVIVNICCFVIFGVLYTIVYKITSGSYYAIVSREGR